MNSYEINPRPTELGGGWRLRLLENGEGWQANQASKWDDNTVLQCLAEGRWQVQLSILHSAAGKLIGAAQAGDCGPGSA